jgi:S1-C subfamily serine protease
MDLKDLNKSQLIMIAVLLSFITSIATGITTVTLMQQAPESFTVPVNRVIRQTVEKIEQVEGKTTVQTVVVKEEDLVVDAIAKNKSAAFSIRKSLYDGEGSLGRGFVVNKEGIVVADALWVSERGSYYIKNDTGEFKAGFLYTDPGGFSFLKIGEPTSTSTKASFTAPTLGDLSKMKAGQKVLVLGSVISSFMFDGNPDMKISSNKSNAGALVLNLDGEVLGMVISAENSSFVPISAITASLAANPDKL